MLFWGSLRLQATGALVQSPNFVAPGEALKISLSAAEAFSNLVGNITTLDETPPSFTLLHVEDWMPSCFQEACMPG